MTPRLDGRRPLLSCALLAAQLALIEAQVFHGSLQHLANVASSWSSSSVKAAAERQEVTIGSSLHSNTKCVVPPGPVNCDNKQLRTDPHADTFHIYPEAGKICARRTDVADPWGLHLVVVCQKVGHWISPPGDYVDEQAGISEVSVVVGSSLYHNEKCVKPPVPVTCDDASAKKHRDDPNPDTFHIYNNEKGEVCAKRIDAADPWGMHLVLYCRQGGQHPLASPARPTRGGWQASKTDGEHNYFGGHAVGSSSEFGSLYSGMSGRAKYDCTHGVREMWTQDKSIWCGHWLTTAEGRQHTSGIVSGYECDGNPDSWTPAQGDWCREHAGLRHNCGVGDGTTWEQAKFDYCCILKGLGCPNAVSSKTVGSEAIEDAASSALDRNDWEKLAAVDMLRREASASSSAASSHMQRYGTKQEEYDCMGDMATLVVRKWCCNRWGMGCSEAEEPPPAPFDCKAGLWNWAKRWTDEKKVWCCTSTGKGCTTTTTTTTTSSPPSEAGPLNQAVISFEVPDEVLQNGLSAEHDYNCTSGSIEAWPSDKQTFCCRHFGTEEFEFMQHFGYCKNASVARKIAPETTFDCDQASGSIDARDWCCKNHVFSKMCPFDCFSGRLLWATGWSEQKKSWCCVQEGSNCSVWKALAAPTPRPQPIFDCSQASGHEHERKWCCENHRFSNMCPFDCHEGLATWVKGWAHKKKSWCCDKESLGCVTASGAAYTFSDCQKGAANDVKLESWCCGHLGICHKPSFDCEVHKAIWVTSWTEAKKEYCCPRAAGSCPGWHHEANQFWSAWPDLHLVHMGSSPVNVKCVTPDIPVVCGPDAGLISTGPEKFLIFRHDDQICAKRTDIGFGWTPELVLHCRKVTHTLEKVDIGSSLDSNTKCVVPESPATCADESAQEGRTDTNPDTFHIYHEGGKICAKRIDHADPWGMNLVLYCKKGSWDDSSYWGHQLFSSADYMVKQELPDSRLLQGKGSKVAVQPVFAFAAATMLLAGLVASRSRGSLRRSAASVGEPEADGLLHQGDDVIIAI